MAILEKNTSRQIFETIRERIMDYNLKPGQRLVERDLADEFGTSRTPIREAMHKLEREGLVILESYKGAYVAPLSLKDMTEVYQVRIALESYAGRLAADGMTAAKLSKLEQINQEISAAVQKGNLKLASTKNKEFHCTIYIGCKNERLYKMIINHWDFARRQRAVVFSVPGRIEAVTLEHIQIIESLRTGDKDQLERQIRQHLEEAQSIFRMAVQQEFILLPK